jgi:hypothetical protein
LDQSARSGHAGGTCSACAGATRAPGAAQDEFEVAVTGETEVNPTLLQMLQTEFDCHCDPEELLAQAGIEGAVDTAEELEVAYRWLTER